MVSKNSALEFQTVDLIKKNQFVKIYHARHLSERKHYLIQQFYPENGITLSPAELVKRYNAIKNLNTRSYLKIHSVQNGDAGVVVVYENFEGQLLETLLNHDPLDLKSALNIGLCLAEAVAHLHKNDLKHTSIRPDNILVSPTDMTVRLIHSEYFKWTPSDLKAYPHPQIIRNILPYLSPEQSGRVKRKVDYRSDFYSMGIVLYRMFTGKLPFDFDDPMEIIHAHIARTPQTPCDVAPAIPKVISEIIMRLLAKPADKRYRSMFGLMEDLNECLLRLEMTGKIPYFEPATKDIPLSFSLPLRIVGRDEEIKYLLSIFKNVQQGKREMLFVTGPPGIGKSALINELHSTVVAQHAYFCWGKYEKIGQDIPYSALFYAFRRLVRLVLSQTKDKIDNFRQRLKTALGSNGRIITNIFPDVGLIIGEQPEVPPIGAQESQNRFNLVFKNFIQAFATPDHPLVVFLDDLQWADTASLDLMKLLLMDPEIAYLFFIGVYPENEVARGHAVDRMCKDIAESTININFLVLPQLEVNHLNGLISDFLQCPPNDSLPLAKLVHRKTNGNPFFFNQFMKTLVDRKLLKVDPISGWHWDTDQINNMQDTDNVADLMVSKIKKLNPDLHDLLSTCACIGRRFKIHLLPKILKKSSEQVAVDLSLALSQGFLSLSDDFYLFNHDRIHETIYNLIPDPKRKMLHLKIGRIAFTEQGHDSILPDDLFFIVNQLNLGKTFITDCDELRHLVQLNFKAGQSAKESAAYSLAWRYFKTGIGLVEPECWHQRHDFTLTLHKEGIEAAYLAGAFDEMIRLGLFVLENERNILKKIAVYEILIKTYLSQNESPKAIKIGLACLSQLGLHFPDRPHLGHQLLSFAKTQLCFLGKTVDKLSELPKMTDPKALSKIQIMTSLAPAAFWVKPALLSLLVFEGLRLSIKNGNAKLSPHIYAGYGFILCDTGFIAMGYRFGQMAKALLKQEHFQDQRARTDLVFYAFIFHWKNHARHALENLLGAYRHGIETGESEIAAYALRSYFFHAFYLSTSLDAVEPELGEYLQILKRLNNKTQFNVACLNYQMVCTLKNTYRKNLSFDDDLWSENAIFNLIKKSGDRTGLFYFYTLKLFIGYLFGQYEAALKMADAASEQVDASRGTLTSTCFYFFEALTCLALYSKVTAATQKKFNKRISRTLKKMKRWAKHAPMNFAHQYQLLKAERYRLSGKNLRASEAFNQAIRLAGQNGYVLHEGVACERHALYRLANGYQSLGRYYLIEAKNIFERWGAKAKVQQLDEAYFHQKFALQGSANKKFGNLDYASVVNSLQTLSKEIVLTELLKKLTKTMAENAGADKVIFISVQNDQMYIEAERYIGTGTAGIPREETIIRRTELEDSHDLLLPAVYYVKRTAEYLLFEDAENVGDYTRDPYIIKNRPQSILCLPIIRQSKLTAILYLENKSTQGVFTADRIETLQLLSSQIAISLENARLYENLTKADNALIESERKYRLLAENVTDNIWVWDFINQKFIYHSPSVKESRGFTQQEAMALSLEQTLPPDDYVRAMNALGQELKNEEAGKYDPTRSLTLEMETYCKDGSTIVTEATMRFMRDENGNPVSILGVSRDITGRKKAEDKIKKLNIELENRVAKRTLELQKSLETLKSTQDQLIQSEKMAALGGLVAGVAHEINTPLSVGLTAATLLEEKTQTQTKLYDHGDLKRSDLEKYLSTARDVSSLINNNLQRVAELVQSFKQVAVDQSTEECRTFNVKNHINELLISLQPKLKKFTHEVQVDCPEDILIYSYPGFFYQILTNLIMNSLIHGFERISNGRIRIQAELNNDQLTINYSDNGHGMSKETLKKMYDPFFTTKRSQGGTGLGMHIIYNVITHSLAGQINCRSREGKGVRFNIRIPVTAKPLQ